MPSVPTLPRPHSFAHAVRLAAAVAALSCTALAQSNGLVTGQVSNAATSIFLEGAEVAVEGTHNYTLTDREGRYELLLPPGVVTLVARYTGLEPQKVTVDVKPGARINQPIALNSGIYRRHARILFRAGRLGVRRRVSEGRA